MSSISSLNNYFYLFFFGSILTPKISETVIARGTINRSTCTYPDWEGDIFRWRVEVFVFVMGIYLLRILAMDYITLLYSSTILSML